MNLALPPVILLIPVGLAALAVGLFSLVNIGNLGRYSPQPAVGLLISFIYISGLTLIVWAAWNLLPAVEWLSPLPLGLIIPQIT